MLKIYLKNILFPFRLFSVMAFSFLFGILACSFIPLNFNRSWPILLLAIFSLLLLGLLCCLWRLRYFLLAIFSLIVFSLGLIYYAFFDSYHAVTLPSGNVQATGQIVNRPAADYRQQKLYLQVYEINGSPVDKFKVLLKLPSFPLLKYGQTISINAEIKEPINYQDFDYRGYLKKDLVYGITEAKEVVVIQEKKTWSEKVVSILYSISSSFEKSINSSIPEPQASIANGIILGVKKNIPENLMEDLNKAGLTHIIALSGFNVTIIVAMFAESIVAWIGRRKTFFIGLSLIASFIVMTGAAASVVRAGIFSSMILLGKTIGRKGDQTNLMLLAALLMVLFNPFVLRYDVGFQLSFLAFSGLIYLAPILKKRFENSRLRIIPNSIRLPLAETLSAQLFVLPIMIFNFGRVSLIAPISNILVLWIIPYTMAASFVTGILGLIFVPLSRIAGFILWPAIEYIIRATEITAKIPLSSIQL